MREKNFWRVESGYIKFRKGIGSVVFSRIVNIMESMRLQEGEKVYMKYNCINYDTDYCQFGIISNHPLDSGFRSSMLFRKRIFVCFTDQNIDAIKPSNIFPGHTILVTPYLSINKINKPEKDMNKILGMILYESPKNISIISNGDEAEKILRECI